jgi:hypothetical protein
VLVQQRANLQRTRIPCPKEIHQATQGSARIDDVLDQQDVLALQLGFGIVQQPNVPTLLCSVAVTRRNEKIDLQRPPDISDQVTEKYKTPFEQA